MEPKNKTKRIVILLALVIFLTFGLSGSVLALWFSNPDKVASDALNNILDAKTSLSQGKYTYSDKKNQTNLNLAFKQQTDIPRLAGSLDVDAKIKYQDFSVNVKGAGMVARSGAVYFKLENFSQLVSDGLKTDYGKLYVNSPSLAAAIKKFATKIDDKWIKLDKNDITSLAAGDYDKQRTCDKKAIASFYDDTSGQAQIIKTYKDNRFFRFEKSNQQNADDSVAYRLKYNAVKSDEFGSQLEKTNLAKALKKCQPGQANSDNQAPKESAKDKHARQKDQQKQADKTTTTVYISHWSHQLKKIKSVTKDKTSLSNFEASFEPNKAVELTDPKKFITLKQLQSDLEAIQTSFFEADPSVST